MDKAERRQRERRGEAAYRDWGQHLFHIRVLDDEDRTLGVIMLEPRGKDGERVYRPIVEHLYDKRGREIHGDRKPNYESSKVKIQEAVGMFRDPTKMNLRPSKIRARKERFGMVRCLEFPTWKARADTLQPVWALLVENGVHEISERGLRMLIQETSGRKRK